MEIGNYLSGQLEKALSGTKFVNRAFQAFTAGSSFLTQENVFEHNTNHIMCQCYSAS